MVGFFMLKQPNYSRRSAMKITSEQLKNIIKEELEKVIEGWAISKKNRKPGQAAGGASLQRPRNLEEPLVNLVKKGEELRGWEKYAQLVALAYKAAPKETTEGLKQLDVLKKHIAKMAPKVEKTYDIKFVDKQPYTSAKDMSDKIKDTGEFEISSQFIQTDDPELRKVNLQNRYVHDFFGHLKGKAHEKGAKLAEFNLLGEIETFLNQSKITPPMARPLLFTMIVGQVCYKIYFGNFPELKIVNLKEFDHEKLGNVEGYKITTDNDLEKTV